jgi:5-methyltetrahydropteroyltriglutamate--homocysteine methyltransferase
MQNYAYGFPRLGKNREFKKFIENFWSKNLKEKELIFLLNCLERERLQVYKDSVDKFPLGEFTYYDNIFDTALIFGVYKFKNLYDYFDYARGKNALELKKYFNTNYHYLVPFLKKGIEFSIEWNKPLFYFKNFSSFKENPIFLIGPYTFLKLCRIEGDFNRLFHKISMAYKELFKILRKNGVQSIHLEEPAFCLDVPKKEVGLILKEYERIIPSSLLVNLITYYESVDFLPLLYELPLSGIGLDFINGIDNLKIIKKKGFPKDKFLICGIVDGRSPLRSDIFAKVKFIEFIKKISGLKEEKIIVSNNCPLYHLPFSIEDEKNILKSIKRKISFAKERLYELKLIKEVQEGNVKEATKWSKDIKERNIKYNEKIFSTLSLPAKEFLERKKIHKRLLSLPLFPTTTIGSFPQDRELRKKRLLFSKKKISLAKYENFIRDKIFKLIEKEEEIGLDVLVHGEFERTDMVEFFARKLDGFLTTQNGWVISYGTRVYRPPIIFEKIKRSSPLTLKEIFYAQSLTPKLVKGIITGPVTILAWSYNLRRDPLHKIAFELAIALNKEVKELVRRGIKIIQIDEPAIKEFSPLKKRKASSYFSWAIRSFNLTARLPAKVQIHTHMCYSEFGEIIKWIMKMNFDVLTIETARDKGKILEAFKKVRFNRAIGPGVWDIHSQYPAKETVIRKILEESIKIFGAENIWLNPDCGLKTRGWEEVEISLRKIAKIAKIYRKKYES